MGEIINKETLEVLITLSPGVVAVGVMYSLQPQMNRGALATGFLVLVVALATSYVVSLVEPHFDLDRWDILAGWAVAGVIGLVASQIVRHDVLHRFLRKWNTTDEFPAHPDPWDAAFAEKSGYIIVRFKRNSVVVSGYPEHWSTQGDKWIRLTDLVWLEGKPEYPSNRVPQSMLVRIKDIDSPVEFVGQNKK